MGYSGYLEYKITAQKLRKNGLSYSEILQQIPVSKDTLSRWCRDISLTNEQQIRLSKRKIVGQKKGLLVAAENKRQLRIENINVINQQSIQELGELSKRDRFIAGLALYTGEGDKGEGKSAFTNSDPLLISFMMQWFNEFCHVPKERLRGAIWLHEGLSEQKAKEYWSKLTAIPITQFHKTYIAKNKPESKKIRKRIHKYGIFAIRFSDTKIQRQILGWIFALFDGKIPKVH